MKKLFLIAMMGLFSTADGLEDIFLGGSAGNSAKILVQDEFGRFLEADNNIWEREKEYEDVDAVFADVNGDGNLDIYVVSGGNELPKENPFYQDRLYLNDGKGDFKQATINGVNNASGSKVKVADYDKDGDLDFFIGGRHVPHEYPLPANSMILENQNGQLINVTEQKAPGLNNLGMVTDAVWNDYDLDGDMDLTVVGEWMPILFFENENGKFSKQVLPGLEKSTGWWFGLEKRI